MLNKQIFETERFATDAVSTVTVSPELRSAAANDDANRQAAGQQRRVRRQPLFASSPIGGWKVRMW